MSGFWKRRFGICHHNIITVCVWNLDCNDFNGKAWDGAYTDFCTRCRLFGSEMQWETMTAGDGKPFYENGRHFIHLINGSEHDEAKNRARWIPIKDFRASFSQGELER
jgi:hypothetical protein